MKSWCRVTPGAIPSRGGPKSASLESRDGWPDTSGDRMKTPLVLFTITLTLLTTFAVQARANERSPGELGLLFGLCRLDRDVVGPGRRADWSPIYGGRFGTSMDRKVDYFLEGMYGRFDTSID